MILATVKDVKDAAVIEHEDDDSFVQRLLEDAEGRLQEYIGSSLLAAQRTEYHDGGTRRLFLNSRPIKQRPDAGALQVARAIGDDANPGLWTPSVVGKSLTEQLDEETADATDYAESPADPAGASFTVLLGALADPLSSAGHVLRYQFAKDAAAGSALDLLVELLQGVDVVASWTEVGISDVATLIVRALTGAQADALTAYEDLRLRVTATRTGGAPARKARLTWAALEVPGPTSTVVVYDTGGSLDPIDHTLVDPTLYRVHHLKGTIERTIGHYPDFWPVGVQRWKTVVISGLEAYPDWNTRVRPALRQSVIDYAVDLYNNRDPRNRGGSSAGVSVQLDGDGIPARVKSVWNAYRAEPC